MGILTPINCQQSSVTFYLLTILLTHLYLPTADTDNYGVITRGKLFLTVDNVTTGYGVGDWYHIPANIEHAAYFETETDEIEFWFKAQAGDRLVTLLER